MENTLEIPTNKLEVIVKESGLESTKAQYILDKFKDSFEFAAKWERQAKTITVIDEKQIAEMKMARVGRLELRAKRLEIENSRKELKEQSLREGKAIDGIANVLKALIVPIEEYLEKQEKFIEIQEENKHEIMRIEIKKRIEEERIAKEKADAEEREKIKVENEKLRAEIIEREKLVIEERKKQEAILAAERAKAEAERKALEEKAIKEREVAEKAAVEAKKKADAERRAVEEKARLEREKLEAERKAVEEKARKEKEKAFAKAEIDRKEKERLAELIKNQIECPHCHKKFQLKK